MAKGRIFKTCLWMEPKKKTSLFWSFREAKNKKKKLNELDPLRANKTAQF